MPATTNKRRTVADRIRHLGACRDALKWASGYTSPAKAWRECESPNWLLWILGATDDSPAGSPSRRKYVAVACGCARLSLTIFEKAFPDDKRPRQSIELCERYAAGEAIPFEDLRRAADAAWRAANAARSAADPARRAANAAWNAADAAWRAANAAWRAADAAWRAANAAWSAADPAWRAARKQSCDIIRRHFPKPPIVKE